MCVQIVATAVIRQLPIFPGVGIPAKQSKVILFNAEIHLKTNPTATLCVQVSVGAINVYVHDSQSEKD